MDQKVAILYQALPPPNFDGICKPMKKGGYSDSGADIACTLRAAGIPLVTPIEKPDLAHDFEWVFPDSEKGIQQALDAGASTFWLNTVLYADHPIINFTRSPIEIIGQQPADVQKFDQKVFTNRLLKKAGLPVPDTTIVDPSKSIPEIEFPVVIKPLRGRGSQGVSKVDNQSQLIETINTLFEQEIYGKQFYVEPYLPGREITISVLPPGKYTFGEHHQYKLKHWALPVVERFSHVNGITPYSGIEPVSTNSRLLPDDAFMNPEIGHIVAACEKCGEILGAKALIRIDCRADSNGIYKIFDVNLKPNMTGPSRPHRTAQESLTLIAAKGLGWTYTELSINLLNQKWPASEIKKI